MLCVQAARRAKAAGSTRFCMGAAWRGPSQVGKGQWARVLGMVKEIRGMGMEVCTTLGMLTPEQARLRLPCTPSDAVRVRFWNMFMPFGAVCVAGYKHTL